MPSPSPTHNSFTLSRSKSSLSQANGAFSRESPYQDRPEARFRLMQDRPLGLLPHLNASPWGFGFVPVPALGSPTPPQGCPSALLPHHNASSPEGSTSSQCRLTWGFRLASMPPLERSASSHVQSEANFHPTSMPVHLGILPRLNAGQAWGFRLVPVPALGSPASPQGCPSALLPHHNASSPGDSTPLQCQPSGASTPPQSPASPTPLKSPASRTTLPTRRRTPRISPARRPPAVQGRPGQTPRSGAH